MRKIYPPYQCQGDEGVVEGSGELPLRSRLVRLPLDHEQLDHAVVLVAYVVLPAHEQGNLQMSLILLITQNRSPNS